jgi:hypothetical protein
MEALSLIGWLEARRSARRGAAFSRDQQRRDGDENRRPKARSRHRRDMIALGDRVNEAPEQFLAMRSGMRLRRSRNYKRSHRHDIS